MASPAENLEGLIAEREDLFRLARELRIANFETTPEQIIDAHDLLLRLRIDGYLPRDRIAWRAYLAPVFCRSPDEQERFYQVFQRWAGQPVVPPSQPPILVPVPPPKRLLKWLLALAVVIAVPVVLWLIKPPGPVVIPWLSTKVPTPKVPGPTSRPPIGQKGFAEELPTRPLELVPPQTVSGWTSADMRLAVSMLPFLFLAGWLAWRIIDRRLILTRQPGHAPDQPHTRWVRGADVDLFAGTDLRYATDRLRATTWYPTRRLHTRRTAVATLRHAGLFTPVYRSRRQQPEYLVLVDRATAPAPAAARAAPPVARDHQAAFAEAFVARLRDEQVIAHVYYFDRDPRRCRPEQTAGRALDLLELEALHGDVRTVLITDAAGFFDPLTSRITPWTAAFERWRHRFVLTPVPASTWGYREASLAWSGFAVAPLDPAGLRLVVDEWLPVAVAGVAEGPTEALRMLLATPHDHVAPLPSIIVEHGDRWLECVLPPQTTAKAVLSALRDYLGETGYLLIRALAVYPELTWPLTLYVDWRLFPGTAAGNRTHRLLALARLPWFRHSRMPDYLRLLLVRDLPRAEHFGIAEIYRQLLKSIDDDGTRSIALEIGSPPADDFRSRLRAWFARSVPTSTYRDQIFTRILLGGRPGLLDIELPRFLSRLFPGTGWHDAVAPLLAGAVVATVAALGIFVSGGFLTTSIDGALLTDEIIRNTALRVTVIGDPTMAWLSQPLATTVAACGFSTSPVQPMPTETYGKGEQRVLQPAPVWEGRHVLQYGANAEAGARWVAERLRYLNYGHEVLLTPGNITLSPAPEPPARQSPGQPAGTKVVDRQAITPPPSGVPSVTTEPISAEQIIIWLADACPDPDSFNLCGTWEAAFPERSDSSGTLKSKGRLRLGYSGKTFTYLWYKSLVVANVRTRKDKALNNNQVVYDWTETARETGSISVMPDYMEWTAESFGEAKYNLADNTWSTIEMKPQKNEYAIQYKREGAKLTLKEDINLDGDFDDVFESPETLTYTRVN